MYIFLFSSFSLVKPPNPYLQDRKKKNTENKQKLLLKTSCLPILWGKCSAFPFHSSWQSLTPVHSAALWEDSNPQSILNIHLSAAPLKSCCLYGVQRIKYHAESFPHLSCTFSMCVASAQHFSNTLNRNSFTLLPDLAINQNQNKMTEKVKEFKIFDLWIKRWRRNLLTSN